MGTLDVVSCFGCRFSGWLYRYAIYLKKSIAKMTYRRVVHVETLLTCQSLHLLLRLQKLAI